MNVDNFIDNRSEVLVNIPDTKTKIPRTFSIVGASYIEIYRKYLALRPSNTTQNMAQINIQHSL